jgi:Domain of unknown function (DUF4412)
MRLSLIAFIAVGCVTPALADPPPLFRPSKDVAVEYRLPGEAGGAGANAQGKSMKMYFTDHGDKMRFDAGDGQGYVVVDNAAKRTTVVMNDRRIYIEHQMDSASSPMLSMADATFTRTGSDTVAGLPCTVYQVVHHDVKGEACLTDDGLLLRSRGGSGGDQRMMEAVKVTYAPQPASLFMPPAGFQKLEMPSMGPGGPGGGPGMGPGQMPPGGMPQTR